MKPTDFSKSLTDFLGLYLPGEKGSSTNTILAYKYTFVLFLNFMKEKYGVGAEKLTLQLIDQQSVIAFLEWLESGRGCSVSTRNARMAALHSFFHYLQYRHPVQMYEWQRILSIPVKKTAKPSISYLSTESITLLLAQPDQQTTKGRRDLALLSLMYDSAARVQEIIDLSPSCISFNRPYTVKLLGKGQKQRIVPLMENQLSLLSSYMRANRLTEPYAASYPLFSNNRYEKFTRMGITLILKKYVRRAAIINPELFPEKVTPHVLRHSKAMHLLQAGVNIVYIRDFLGHTSVSTTEIYARADTKMKREALEKAYVDITQKAEDPRWLRDNELLEWLKQLK